MIGNEFQEKPVVYNFNYSNAVTGEAMSMTREFDTDYVTWDDVLYQFLNFMSACYGYDIKDRVEIDPPSANGAWCGQKNQEF